MEGDFSEGDRDALVEVVKTAQELNIKGRNGEWKEFLCFNNLSLAQCDPAKQSWQTLAKFVQSFTPEDRIKMVKQTRRWYKWYVRTMLADETDPWPRTSEQSLVTLTRQNPRYKSFYTFPSFRPGWKWTKRGASSSATNPERILSLDCEMVMCEGYEQQVVQVCIVDRNYETVLSTLVKPSKKVVDYVTYIHGISKDDIDKATCTQGEIQKKVKSLLKPGTILVGHSVHNDLKALKIDHQRVIDTSLILRPKGVPYTAPISLDKLCQAFLGYSLREFGKHHDCLEDAIVPMKLLMYALKEGSNSHLFEKVHRRDSARLCVHKIPQHVTMEELRKLISDTCTLEKIAGKRGQVHAVFPSTEIAEKAFDMLPGELGQDSSGLEQKKVSRWIRAQYVEFRVRKMVHKRESKRPLEEADVALDSKKQKREETKGGGT